MLEPLLKASSAHIAGQERANKKEEAESLAQRLMWQSAQGPNAQGSWGAPAVTPTAFLPSAWQPAPTLLLIQWNQRCPLTQHAWAVFPERIIKATQWSQGFHPCSGWKKCNFLRSAKGSPSSYMVGWLVHWGSVDSLLSDSGCLILTGCLAKCFSTWINYVVFFF